MSRFTVTQRLVLVYCVLMLASTGAFAWLQVRSSALQEQKLVQLLSVDVADHIADNAEFMDADGLKRDAVRSLFDQLMTVNPSVEVYVLDENGQILGHAAPPGHVKREIVDVEPIERWLAGEPAPILGDDPRSTTARKVFSAARLQGDGRTWGYVYVILLGEARDMLASDVAARGALGPTLGWMVVVALLGLVAGVMAFRQITRPLRALTESMHGLDVGNPGASLQGPESGVRSAEERDEIAILKSAFGKMTERIAEQWRALKRQDEQRREFVANVSHDLRTPLTSLQGYLETLESKGDALGESDRQRYLGAARALSEKVGRLAAELLELARLEHEAAIPRKEPFSLVDLVQDVFEKLSLLADEKKQKLVADIPEGIPDVLGSLPMIERVLTNLIDNAIRHTPEGTEIVVALRQAGEAVEVSVSDDGPGIPVHVREYLDGEVEARRTGRVGGLGLRIVRRILELHDSRMENADTGGSGAKMSFRIEACSQEN